VNSAGLGTGGSLRKLCGRLNCRQIALKASLYCRHHDFDRKRKRLAELRSGKSRLRATPTELARIFRSDTKSLWQREPWFPAMTIWLAKFEVAFTEDIRRAGLSPSRTAPACLDTLRWAWKRSVLDYNDAAGWDRAVNAARKRMAKIGPPPEDFSYVPPSDTPPDNPSIRVVLRRLNAVELAKTRFPVDRSTKSKARRRRFAPVKTPAGFDWQAFFQQHWMDVFRPIWRAHQLDDVDVGGELGRRMAIALKDALDEEQRTGTDGSIGPAREKWLKLLGQLAQGERPVPDPVERRPPLLPEAAAPQQLGAPGNDAWVRGLVERVRADDPEGW
jgi:hypothetical protein